VPVTRVSFADALVYADWLSAQTGHHYRLLSEAEWEYMARGGTRTAYFFGDDPDELCGYGNVADIALRTRYTGFDTADCDDGYVELAPVASFRPNPFGIHDVHGNVAEWVLECGMPAYQGAPDDATPIDPGARCPTHGVRGGSWDGTVSDARSSKRNLASSAGGDRGIRLLREL
jgi:formylglycine-generating enzyme required for sulfatase activity